MKTTVINHNYKTNTKINCTSIFFYHPHPYQTDFSRARNDRAWRSVNKIDIITLIFSSTPTMNRKKKKILSCQTQKDLKQKRFRNKRSLTEIKFSKSIKSESSSMQGYQNGIQVIFSCPWCCKQNFRRWGQMHSIMTSYSCIPVNGWNASHSKIQLPQQERAQ